MVKSQARSEKEGFILVQLYYGDNLLTQPRYTDWDQDFLGHTSTPSMELTLPENDGSFSRRELRIDLPTDSFTTRLSSGVKHSRVYAIVQEVTQGLSTGDQNSQKTLYRGRLVRVIRNYENANNRVAMFFLPQKSRLDITPAIGCTHQCWWNLFRGNCGASTTGKILTTEIDSKDGHEVTITDATVLAKAVGDARFWKRGYMEKDGLRIDIRDYDGATDDTKFFMSDPVPTDWVAGSNDITIVSGCDKTIETCRSRHNAEEFFMGLGHGLPDYQPNLESPS